MATSGSPGGHSDSAASSLSKLVVRLKQESNVAHFMKEFIGSMKPILDEGGATLEDIQEAFVEARAHLDHKQQLEATERWNRYQKGINSNFPPVPPPPPRSKEFEKEQIGVPIVEILGADEQPEPVPDPVTAPVLNSEAKPAVHFSGGELSLTGRPTKAKPEVNVVQDEVPLAGQLTLTDEQLVGYSSLRQPGKTDGQVFADTLKQAAAHPKKNQTSLDALVETSLVLAMAAKQELMNVQKSQQTLDTLSPENEEQLAQVKQRHHMAQQTYQHLQEVQALNHVKTQLSDAQLQQQLKAKFSEMPEGSGAQALQSTLNDLTKEHGKAKRQLKDKGIDHVSFFKKHRTFTVKITDEGTGKKIGGKIFFSNKDLIHPSKPEDAAKAYSDMKARAHDFLTIGIAQAGLGSKENPFELHSKPPPSNELLVQAVMDLKERAVLEGKEFYMKDKQGKVFTITPDPVLNAQEKAYFNDLAKEKSYTLKGGAKRVSLTTAGENVLKHCVQEYAPDKPAADQWQDHLNATVTLKKEAFSNSVDDTFKPQEPDKTTTRRPGR